MSKAKDDIETLKAWCNYVLRKRPESSEEDIDAASAVLNLISLVGTIRANTIEEAARLCESQADFCCGGATYRCAKIIRAMK